MIYVYCNWVCTRWLRSVTLYKNRKETAIYNIQNNTNAQNTQNRKQTYKEY